MLVIMVMLMVVMVKIRTVVFAVGCGPPGMLWNLRPSGTSGTRSVLKFSRGRRQRALQECPGEDAGWLWCSRVFNLR